MSSGLNNFYIKFLLSVLVFSTFLLLLRVFLLDSYPDFSTNYFAAKHILNKQDPFMPDINYFTPQVYPPSTMSFFIPLALLPYEVASKLWILLSLVAFLSTIYLLVKLNKVKFFSPPILLFLILSFLAFPLKFTLGMGQLNVILLLFLTTFYYYFSKGKDVKAGIFLALPILLKFFPLILLPYLFIIKKWKLLGVSIITLLVLLAVTSILLPFQIIINYYTNIVPELVTSWKGDYYNQSLSGVLIRSFPDMNLASILRAIFSLFFIGITFLLILFHQKKTRQRIAIEISSLITLNILINNFSWQHHFIFLTIPFFLVTFTMHKIRADKLCYCALFTSYFLIAANLKSPSMFPVIIQNHVFFGGLVLWLVTIYLLLRGNLK